MSNLDLIAKKGEKKVFSKLFYTSDDSSSEESSSDEDIDIDEDATLDKSGLGSKNIVEHYSRSGNLKIILAQDAIRGIAHQLWPAASLLCNYFEDQSEKLISQYRRESVSTQPVADIAVPELGGGALPPTPPLSPSNCTSGSLETKSKINILELGAGIGLCGIFLKKQFPESIGQVVITDLPEAIEAINKNIELNSLSVEADCIRAEVLSWGIESDSSKVAIDVFGNRHIDYVIAADCVYWECLFAPFAETLVYFANRGSKIIIAHVRRWKKDGKFFDLCKRKGLTVTILDEIVGTDTNEHTGQSIRSIKRIYQICK